MSFHFYLYSAPDGLPPMNRWSEMHAAPLGSADQVKEKLSALYPELKWKRQDKFWLGWTDRMEPYLDILLAEEEPNSCFFVVLNKAAPSVMRRIMEALGLNYVSAPEAGDLVDPYAYTDADQTYAKRKWDQDAP